MLFWKQNLHWSALDDMKQPTHYLKIKTFRENQQFILLYLDKLISG